MKLIITESQYKILSEAYTQEELRKKYVDSELVPEDKFNEIISEFNKPFYVGWLLKMVSMGNIKYEDVYKFKHYFNVFEKFKQHYPIKDLGQIKTFDDVEEFERKSKDILIKQQETEQGDVSDKKNLVSLNDIQKLESVGIKYLGMVDELQAFQVPSEVKDSKEAWSTYREILGRCSDRDEGELVSICTMQGFDNFQDYLTKYPGSSYYVFYNLGDPNSPYQIHYESVQFMDKNNEDISDNLKAKFTKFLLTKDLNKDIVPFFLKKMSGIKLDKTIEKSLNQIGIFFKKFVDGCEVNEEDNQITNDSLKIRLNFRYKRGFSYIGGNVSSILAYKSGAKYRFGFGIYCNKLLAHLLNEKFPKYNIKSVPFLLEKNVNWGENTGITDIIKMRDEDNKIR